MTVAKTSAEAANPAVARLLAPLGRWLGAGDRVIEIQVNRPGEAWIEREVAADGRVTSRFERVPVPELTRQWAENLGHVLANVRSLPFSAERPSLAVLLPGGHRLQLVTGKYVASGVALSIRVHRNRRYELEAFGLEGEELERLRNLARRRGCIVVSGQTGTGKTAFLNALLREVPGEERIVTVEDVRELEVLQANNVALLVGRLATGGDLGYREMIDAVTRLRPDLVVGGELSVDSAAAYLRLLTLGHGGFMTTLHADSPLAALVAWRRNVELGSNSATGGPAVLQLLARALDAVVQLDRVRGERRVSDIAFRPAGGILEVDWERLL